MKKKTLGYISSTKYLFRFKYFSFYKGKYISFVRIIFWSSKTTNKIIIKKFQGATKLHQDHQEQNILFLAFLNSLFYSQLFSM